jgi:O-antigen ligase
VISTSTRPGGSHDRLDTLLWAATLIWVVGMATLFPLGNAALEAVSVFTLDRIAYLIVAALLAVAVARHPSLLRQGGRLEAMMALYLAVVLISWATTLPRKNGIDVKRDVNLLWGGFVMPYTAFLVARHAGWTRRQVAAALWVVVLGVGGFLISVGFVQGLIDWRFLVAARDQTTHFTRIRGPFRNAVPYAVVLSLIVPIALTLYARQPPGRKRLLLLALLVAFVEALVLSQVRVVWLALPLALLYFAATGLPARRSAAVFAAGLIVAVGLASIRVDARGIARAEGAAQQANGVGGRLADAESAYNRVAVYSTALNMIAHQPLLGLGFGAHTFETSRSDYLTSCCGVSPEWAIPCAVPHNEVLNVLVLMGAVGLLVYLGVVREIWRLLSAGRAAAPEARSATLVAAVQADFIVLAIAFQLHDVMYLSVVQVLFFFLVGLVVPYRQ